MIAILGDIHGDNMVLLASAYKAKEKGAVALIQVGDLGWYPGTVNRFSHPYPIPVYWIDGNHEDHRLLQKYTEITEIYPNFFFVPRGARLELDGKRILFCGGAGSVDKAFNRLWSAGENITDEEMARMDSVENVDLMITHVPPQCTIEKYFNRMDLAMYFGLPTTWTDPNAVKIEDVWVRAGKPRLICGHMHRVVSDGGVRILDIDELLFL